MRSRRVADSGQGTLVGRPAGRLRAAAPRGLRLGLARRLGAPQGCLRITASSARGTQRAELRKRLGERAVRVAERRLEVEVPLGDRLGQDPALGREIRLRRGTLAGDPCPIPGDASIRRLPRLSEPERA